MNGQPDMTPSKSAVGAAALLTGVAGYQVAVAAGAPLGGHVWGGRFGPVPPPRIRVASGLAAVVLVAAALVVLAAAGRLRLPFLERRAAQRVTAVLAAYFALNTVGNVASKSVVERVMMGSITSILTVLLARVGRRPPP